MIKYEAFDGDACNVIGAFKLKGDLVDVHWSLQGVVVDMKAVVLGFCFFVIPFVFPP